MPFTHVIEGERDQFYILSKAGKGVREVARQTGRDAATVGRELQRNTGARGRRGKGGRGPVPASRDFSLSLLDTPPFCGKAPSFKQGEIPCPSSPRAVLRWLSAGRSFVRCRKT
jgi:hypothetical protein